ncbi:MAG: stage II sporulation protein P [Syntrophomonadaceae bacterium]
METLSRRYIWIFFGVLLAVMIGAYILNTLNTPIPKKPVPGLDEQVSSYSIIKDTFGVTILETGLPVHIDDRYIDTNNVEYVVIGMDGPNAVADIVTRTTGGIPPDNSTAAIPKPVFFNRALPVQGVNAPHHVVIYHTHTDESYIPTSGKASQPGAGDIYTVGTALADSLQKSGISVSHSVNAHDPHDRNAYHRSRRTVAQLLKEQPDVAFDIHRDSAPASAYSTTINGVDCSRIMMVVGRSNPNMKSNLAYARRIKAQADQLYPGLIRGIFMGKGDYNQDLYPTGILFEIGTDSIPLELAENAARCLGDVILQVFYQG